MSGNGCNGNCDDCHCGSEEVLAGAFMHALNVATLSAINRLTKIITDGDPDEAVNACDTLFSFAMDLAAQSQPEEEA